jgi:multiple sugar transport system ATP-binding protein
MAQIDLIKVEKKFGDLHAVKPMDLTIHNGEFVVLLGPSGCGKTTTLRMIAGLETVTGGSIQINGQDITNKPARERDIAMVFQFFALYPHMTVRENIAFPLQAQGENRSVIDQRVSEVVRMLQIEPYMKLRPGSLSGGDQQRVALARALVRRPAAFLMDEPLGALDADFRESMRAEIKRLHLVNNATSVYVTHDQIEAMAMGDRIVVMSNATVQQVGTPIDVYNNPSNMFVARFIGSPGMNLVTGEHHAGTLTLPGGSQYAVPSKWRTALEGRSKVVLGFRPEALLLDETGQVSAKVYGDDLHGSFTMLHLALNGESEVIHGRAERGVASKIGAQVAFTLDPEMVRFFDPESETAIVLEVRHG